MEKILVWFLAPIIGSLVLALVRIVYQKQHSIYNLADGRYWLPNAMSETVVNHLHQLTYLHTWTVPIMNHLISGVPDQILFSTLSPIASCIRDLLCTTFRAKQLYLDNIFIFQDQTQPLSYQHPDLRFGQNDYTVLLALHNCDVYFIDPPREHIPLKPGHLLLYRSNIQNMCSIQSGPFLVFLYRCTPFRNPAFKLSQYYLKRQRERPRGNGGMKSKTKKTTINRKLTPFLLDFYYKSPSPFL